MVVVCDECQGKRFDLETLSISYKGKTIADILDMSFEEAESFFTGFPVLKAKNRSNKFYWSWISEIRSTSNYLSGGEAQRIKLSKRIVKEKYRKNFIYTG